MQTCILFIVVLFATCTSQELEECKYSDVLLNKRKTLQEECPPSWISKRIETLATNSGESFAKMLSKSEALNSAKGIAEVLYKYLDTKESLKDELRWQKNDAELKKRWNTVNDKKKAFGFGCIDPDVSVLQDFEGVEKEIETPEGPIIERQFKQERKLSKTLYENVFNFETFLRSKGSEVVRGYGFDWKRPFSMNFYQISEDDGFFTCTVADVLAYYVEGEWSIAASITNSSVYKEAEDYNRHYFTELLTFTENGELKLEPKQIKLSTCDDSLNETGILEKTRGTAIYEKYEGKTQPEHFVSSEWDSNPAINTALQRGELQKELVRDATSISNAAILIVPAILAFLPISFFHEVGIGSSLIYIVATDIISVVPLFIKGIELSHFGRQKQWAVQSYVYGMEDRTMDGVVELWTAKCEMRPNIKQIGLAFLITSIAIMILGITFEVVCSIILHRKKSEWEDLERKPDAGLIWYWKNERYKNPKVV